MYDEINDLHVRSRPHSKIKKKPYKKNHVMVREAYPYTISNCLFRRADATLGESVSL